MTQRSPVELTEFNRTLRIALLLPVALLALLAGLLVWQFEATLDIQRLVDYHQRIISQLDTLQRLALDQETGIRGFQLTGVPSTLDPYLQAKAPIESTLHSLRRLCAGNSRDLSDLNRIEFSLRSWQSFAETTREALTLNFHPSEEVTLRGKRLMDALRGQIEDLAEAESVARDALAARVRRRIDDFLAIVLILALLAGVIIGVFTNSRLRRVSSVYDAALHQLSERNEELAENRQLLLATLESIGDAVFTCDRAGCILYMNAVAQELTQWPLTEAAHKPLDLVVHLLDEESHAPVGPLLDESRRSGHGRLTSHNVLVSRDGAEHSIDCTITPVRNPQQDAGAVVVLRDVTELRRAQASLVSNEKLAVAGRLAASIAHEIHNPLDSVASLHFLLADEEDPQKRAEYLALAQQELSRTLQISRAMLSLYRESQTPVRVSIEELIASVLLLLNRKLRDQSTAVETSFEPSSVVEGFPGELRQVFTNLISNAVEAAGPRGTVRIRVGAAPAEYGAPGVLVEIADSGPGIAPNMEKRLFQPFATTKGERGTGLGLWVSLGIVQKHGGALTIENGAADLSGALVRVYLPETAAQPQASEAAALAVS